MLAFSNTLHISIRYELYSFYLFSISYNYLIFMINVEKLRYLTLII